MKMRSTVLALITLAIANDAAAQRRAVTVDDQLAVQDVGSPELSPDGKWLAQALTDGATTNLWALSTTTCEWRQITDFGERTTFIVRRVSWSSDGSSLLAAVGEGDSDIVLLEGLTARGRE